MRRAEENISLRPIPADLGPGHHGNPGGSDFGHHGWHVGKLDPDVIYARAFRAAGRLLLAKKNECVGQLDVSDGTELAGFRKSETKVGDRLRLFDNEKP